MNKKRFKYEYGLIWNENGEKFDVNECEGRRLVCDKLNEQQSTIEHLTVEKFKENKRFTKLLSEQQATIRKLQDLCGESDSENAKLRIENKRLQEENEQLKKQIQIYEQLISNSYVGEEETLDGFVGKYVIWEDELQKYRKKIKKGD